MTRRQLTILLAVLLAIPLMLLGAVGLLAGTEPGTRWIIRLAEPYLPEQLEIGEAQGTLLGGIEFDSIHWRDGDTRIEATGVATNAALFPLLDREVRITTLQVDRLDIALPEKQGESEAKELPEISLPITLRVDAAVITDITLDVPGLQRRIRRIELSAGFADSWLRVDRLDVDSDWLVLDIGGRLRLAGRYATDLAGTWRFRAGGENPEFAGNLSVDGDRQSYAVSHDLTAPLSIATRGAIRMDAATPIVDLVNTWTSLDWPIAERKLSLDAGQLAANGPIDELAVSLVTSGSIDPVPETALSLEGLLRSDRFEVLALSLEGEPGHVDLSGQFGWSETPAFDVRVSARDLDPAILSPQISGDIGLRGTATGTLTPAGWVMTVLVDTLAGNVNDEVLDGSADIAIAGRGVSLNKLVVSLGDNTVSASGEIAETLALEADLELRRLDQLDERLRGDLSGGLIVSGRREAPAGAIEISVSRPGWNDVEAAALSIDARLSSSQSIVAAVTTDELIAGPLVISAARFDVDGDREAHRFSLTANGSRGRLDINGSGRLDEGRWYGRLGTLTVDTDVLRQWSLDKPIDVVASASEASASSFCLQAEAGGGRVCGSANYRAESGGDLELGIRELPLAALPITLPAGARLDGTLASDVAVRLDDDGIGGTVNLSLLDTRFDAVYEDEPYSLALTTATLDADVISNRLQSRLAVDLDDAAGQVRAAFSVEDILNIESAISGDASVALPDISLLAFLAPDLSDLQGRVEGTLEASGSLQAPDYSGEVVLADGSFGVRPAGIQISEMQVRLRQLDAGRLQLSGSARSGDGDIELDGSTSIGTDAGLRAEVRISGDRFELARLPDLRVAASPNIKLALDDRAATVTGSVSVPSADITVKQIPETAVRPSGDVVVHGDGASEVQRARRIDVDIDATLGEEVRLSGFGLTTRITGGVRLVGGTGRPYTGTGSLRLNEGRYKAYGQDLDIESGELIFNGPLSDPQLSVRAVRRIETSDVIAGIRVSGTPRNLRSEVFSEPTMSDAEALSYLLTGRPLSGPTNAEDADLLNQAAFALGLSQAGSIASQIKGDLGLDTLAIEGGSESGRIVAGRRLGDRLVVEYGYGLVDKLGTLLLRYQLTNRLILESRTGTVSEFDVIYTVKRK